MMKNRYKIILMSLVTLLGVSCNQLDRPPMTTSTDDSYWSNENAVRLYANGFYENNFIGYNSGWGSAYTPLRGYNFSDDFTGSGKQTGFEVSVPSSRVSTSTSPSMLSYYGGSSWNFAYVRKVNVMLARIENNMKDVLSEEQYNHWMAVGKFFRGMEYSRLVTSFGDVPYYDIELLDSDKDNLFKDRDDRTTVMDNVAADFKYVLSNIRVSDGDSQYLNKYIAASFISRAMLFEASWQKYHLNNTAKAKEYFELAVEAAEVVMNSGKYAFTSDFRSLFGSDDLSGNGEVILHRTYDAALGVTHCIASYSNRIESVGKDANLSLVKSFICNDGNPYQLSSTPDADNFEIKNLVKSRDPRFEATFYDEPWIKSRTLLYSSKFISRDRDNYGDALPSIYVSVTNTGDAPVIRYAEVVLNWIEAKAEIAEMGGAAVTQDDIDASINAIRDRPLDEAAIAKGVQKTAHLSLAALPNDPSKDADVSALLWEIRRERRMEFIYEFARLTDLRRWKKLNYMQGSSNPDILLGPWVDFPTDFKDFLTAEKENVLKVQNADGEVVIYNGTNGADMVGFYIPEDVQDREAIEDKNYLSPVGAAQISDYADRGYTLTQTKGW